MMDELKVYTEEQLNQFDEFIGSKKLNTCCDNMILGIAREKYLIPVMTSEEGAPAYYENLVKASCDNCATVRFLDPELMI